MTFFSCRNLKKKVQIFFKKKITVKLDPIPTNPSKDLSSFVNRVISVCCCLINFFKNSKIYSPMIIQHLLHRFYLFYLLEIQLFDQLNVKFPKTMVIFFLEFFFLKKKFTFACFLLSYDHVQV